MFVMTVLMLTASPDDRRLTSRTIACIDAMAKTEDGEDKQSQGSKPFWRIILSESFQTTKYLANMTLGRERRACNTDTKAMPRSKRLLSLCHTRCANLRIQWILKEEIGGVVYT